jgi:hypothetical protein
VAESEDQGRCVNCEFLGKRVVDQGPRAIAPAYYDIDRRGRDSGDVFGCVQEPLVGTIPAEAFWFLQVAALKEEIDSLYKDSGGFKAATQVFTRDRNCSSWYRYNPGLSPKDRFDQMNMELLEQSRREWATRLETERKDFDMKLFKMSQEIQATNQRIATRFTVAMIILTLVQIFVALDWGRATFREWVDQLGNLLIQKMSGG